MTPPRTFYSLHEISARWSVTSFDVVGWAIEGLVALSVVLPPIKIAPSETISGLMDIEAAHVFPLFRRGDAQSLSTPLRQVRDGKQVTHWIVDPSEGVTITQADVLVRHREVQRFEKEHGLLREYVVAPEYSDAPRRKGGPGVPPKHDWDGFYGALARRIHDHGIPKTQAELVREMLDWFGAKGDEHAPDESTVRRKVQGVWRELSRA